MMNLVNFLNFCTELVGKGSAEPGIPTAVGNLVHNGITIIQVVVPILLVAWGMLDFAKAVMGQDDDKIKAGQKKFVQRAIAAVFVFLIVTVVQLVINVVGSVTKGSAGDSSADAWRCAKCLINGKEDQCKQTQQQQG